MAPVHGILNAFGVIGLAITHSLNLVVPVVIRAVVALLMGAECVISFKL